MTKIKFIAVLAALVLGTGAVKGFEPTETTEVETAMKTKANPKPKKGRTISLWGLSSLNPHPSTAAPLHLARPKIKIVCTPKKQRQHKSI